MFIDRRCRTMWYVIQVKGGTEENIKQQCQNTISPPVLEKCFYSLIRTDETVSGKWNKRKENFISGICVYGERTRLRELYFELKNVIGLTKILGAGNEVVPLNLERSRLPETTGMRKNRLWRYLKAWSKARTWFCYQGPAAGSWKDVLER